MSESNRKAYSLASLGLVHVTAVDESGRPTEAIVPAQHGEFAVVSLRRTGANIECYSCIHRKCLGGGERRCEANEKGQPCYHAKAVMVWQAQCKDMAAVLCMNEEGAREMVKDVRGARAGCLCSKPGGPEQWIAFMPGENAEAQREAQEVAHLSAALVPILEAINKITMPKRAKG